MPRSLYVIPTRAGIQVCWGFWEPGASLGLQSRVRRGHPKVSPDVRKVKVYA
jgi:hypothetical protein